MNTVTRVFGRPSVVLPVIHALDEGQAIRNVRIAGDAGADGVFPINRGVAARRLVEIREAGCSRSSARPASPPSSRSSTANPLRPAAPGFPAGRFIRREARS